MAPCEVKNDRDARLVNVWRADSACHDGFFRIRAGDMGGVVGTSRRAGRRGPRARSGVPAPDQWLIWSCRCQIPAFTDLARKISKHAARSKAHYDLSNALVESSNTKIRLLTRIESSCKSPEALIAFVMLPRRLPTLTARKNQPRMIHEIRIAVTTSRSQSVWGPTASGVLNPCTSAVRAVRQRCSAGRAGNAQRISSAARPSHSA